MLFCPALYAGCYFVCIKNDSFLFVGAYKLCFLSLFICPRAKKVPAKARFLLSGHIKYGFYSGLYAPRVKNTIKKYMFKNKRASRRSRCISGSNL